MLGKLNQKKVWAQILIFALLFAMLPTAALAEENVVAQEQITVSAETPFPDELDDGKSYRITLGIDVTLEKDFSVTQNSELTLDLNGHTLTLGAQGSDGNMVRFINDGTMTIQDSDSAGNGAIAMASSGYTLVNEGTMSVESGTIGKPTEDCDGIPWAVSFFNIGRPGNQVLEISGGTFLGEIMHAEAGPNPAITITDGTFREKIYTSGTANISGGTFEKEICVDTLKISGGTFESAITDISGLEASITSGSFKVLCPAMMDGVASGYEVVLGADGRYSVQARGAALPPASPGINVEYDEQGVAKITLTAEENLEIWYSTEYPYTEFHKYTQPVSVSDYYTVYAYTVGTSGVVSKLASQTINPVETPQATPAPGSYQNRVQVTLTAGADAQILYTTNGEIPSLTAANGTKTYDGPFTLTTSATVKAIAYENGGFSDTLTAVYTITNESGGGSGGGSGGSSSSSSNQSNTSTTKNPDGSTTTTTTDKATGTVTEVTKGKDGTVTTVETKKDGTVTETVKADGMTSTVVTDKDGTITKAEVNIGNITTNQTVVLPVGVPIVSNIAFAPKLEIYLADTSSNIKVAIPVKNVTTSTVAVLVAADGSEKIVPTSVATEEGVVLPLHGSATVKVVDNSKDFADVSASFWASDSVAFVTSRELFNGTSAKTFTPNAPMTREMLMTVLARLDGADTTVSPLAQGMAWATEKGISDGSNPGGSISREQLATMLYRYAGSPAASGSLADFNDADSVGGYAQEAIQWAVGNRIISGTGSGTLNPQGEATRAQVAAMLQRYIVSLNG